MVNHWLIMAGWWLSHQPLWQMMEWVKVSWDDILNIWKVIKYVPNHQPDMVYSWWKNRQSIPIPGTCPLTRPHLPVPGEWKHRRPINFHHWILGIGGSARLIFVGFLRKTMENYGWNIYDIYDHSAHSRGVIWCHLILQAPNRHPRHEIRSHRFRGKNFLWPHPFIWLGFFISSKM